MEGGAHTPQAKLLMPATQQANSLESVGAGQGIASVFGKPADQGDGGLVSQTTILPGLEANFFFLIEQRGGGEEVK